MSKTCKDFGEVLVALGQGKIVIDVFARRVTLLDGWFQAYCEAHDDWAVLEREDIHFDYPAPIYEAPKEVEIDVWINVYEGGRWIDHPTKTKADSYKDPSRIACVNIKRTVTEGEGL